MSTPPPAQPPRPAAGVEHERTTWHRLRPLRVLARHELSLLLRDPVPLLLMVALPLTIVVFFREALELALFYEGHVHADGAAQAVPGVAVTFGFFLVGWVGLSFFRDHGWGTWARLGSLAMPRWQVVVGKVAPLVVVAWLQQAALFALGAALFGLRVEGSPWALGLVAAALAPVPVLAGVVVVSLARTLQQVNVVANLGAIVLAGMGGGLVPLSLLPGWVRAVAPASPAYWAMDGMRTVVLDGGGVVDVLAPVGVLLGWSAVLATVAFVRMVPSERQLAWA